MILPPRPRLRTTTPKHWPSVCRTRWPAMPSVVATNMSFPHFHPGPVTATVRPSNGYILTLVAARESTTLTGGIVSSVRDAVGGGAVETLAAGEAVDIAL